MDWHWPTLYICIGLIGMLLGDDDIQEQNPNNPWGVRILMCTFWPVVVVSLVLYVVRYWFEEDDDGC